MASGVSIKMGVTGVAQFKQSMKESQAAVKNLDQQLKLNEAQLKLNGNEAGTQSYGLVAELAVAYFAK